MAAGTQELLQVLPRRLPEAHVADRRDPVEPDRREGDDERAEPELGHRQSGDRDHPADVVRQSVLMRGREHADRDGDDQAQDHGQRRQLEGDGDGLPERDRDGLVGEDGVARIEAHHLPDPDEVLLVVRQVETEVLAELLQLLLADVAGLGHEGRQRVAGHDAHQAEDDQRRQHEHRHGQQHPPEHVLVHGDELRVSPYLSNQVRASMGEP